MNWTFHLNASFYIIGSCLFIVGSILFHPHFSVTSILYKTGVLTFTFGSVLFGVAALQQLIGDFQRLSANSNVLREPSNSIDTDVAVSFCRNTIGSISGLLFTLGSIAFWPSYEHAGALVGNWLYRCGATLGLISSFWSLIRQQHPCRYSTLKLMTLLSLFGSIGFLIGGAFFLYGGAYDMQGSLAWLAGSLSFLCSSLLIYKL
jgi:hypothetical protein